MFICVFPCVFSLHVALPPAPAPKEFPWGGLVINLGNLFEGPRMGSTIEPTHPHGGWQPKFFLHAWENRGFTHTTPAFTHPQRITLFGFPPSCGKTAPHASPVRFAQWTDIGEYFWSHRNPAGSSQKFRYIPPKYIPPNYVLPKYIPPKRLCEVDVEKILFSA